MKKLLLIAIVVISVNIQNIFAGTSDTIWNQTDKNGLKQGYWKVNYDNGKIKYQSFFQGNKPMGELKRYYEDGTIKAIMEFYNKGERSRSKIFYENGEIAAEGNFIGTEKDSIWKYYSYFDKTLRMEENYKNGVKDGVSKKYFPNGNIAEELNWTNNKKNGDWIQRYENGNIKLKSFYQNDNRNGDFQVFYEDNKPEIKGQFSDNLMQGNWVYYDENGNEKTKIIYINNVPQNASQLEQEQQEYFKMIEENKGKIPEPDENSLIPTR